MNSNSNARIISTLNVVRLRLPNLEKQSIRFNGRDFAKLYLTYIWLQEICKVDIYKYINKGCEISLNGFGFVEYSFDISIDVDIFYFIKASVESIFFDFDLTKKNLKN